ncbi:MAG: hypothetical protein QNK37_04030 [Acidobacteriota bacterium]|nr:hypothetical protein [Acidobacteriota bacterium]
MSNFNVYVIDVLANWELGIDGILAGGTVYFTDTLNPTWLPPNGDPLTEVTSDRTGFNKYLVTGTGGVTYRYEVQDLTYLFQVLGNGGLNNVVFKSSTAGAPIVNVVIDTGFQNILINWQNDRGPAVDVYLNGNFQGQYPNPGGSSPTAEIPIQVGFYRLQLDSGSEKNPTILQATGTDELEIDIPPPLAKGSGDGGIPEKGSW